METLFIIINIVVGLALVAAGALIHRIWRKSQQKADAQSQKLKQQILASLPVKSVDIVSCRGLTSFYAMEKGLIIGY